MEKQPDQYVQKNRIWNPIEEKWEPRNSFRYSDEDFSRESSDFAAFPRKRISQAFDKTVSSHDRTFSGASGSAPADVWKVIRSVLVGVISLFVFGNVLVNVLNLLLFGY